MHCSEASPADSLHKEYEASRELFELLKREQAQLIESDIDGVAALTEEKTRLVAQLADLASKRYQALALAGFTANEAGMQQWVDSSSTTAAAKKSWTDLLVLARSAKEMNRTNGLLINKHLMRTQEALTVLRGNSHAGNFYGPNGQSTPNTGTRNLVVG